MITIQNIKKSFKDVEVLKGLSLTVNKGDVYGFIGKNGAGKTTTLKLITGFLKENSGSISIDSDISIGYLPESPTFYDYMTAYEYLMFLGKIKRINTDILIPRIKDLLSTVGLKKDRKKISHYSRGMQQRLGMASILLHDPDVLLLDEPSSALDPAGRKDILDLMLKLKDQGKTIFFSTHILTDVEKVCNKIGILSEGVLIKEDETDVLLKSSSHYIIETENSMRDYETLKQHPKIQSVQLIENYLKVDVTGDVNLFKELCILDMDVLSFNKHTQTLEELFMKVVK